MDETQETLRTSAFPSSHVKVSLQLQPMETHPMLQISVATVSSVTILILPRENFVGEMGEESLHSFDLLRTNRVLIVEERGGCADSVRWLASRD
jgi:hypothetical protein